jgi:MFS family permease
METFSRSDARSDERGVTFAWNTHSAITDWTAKVDYKAAIVLSLGGILLGFFVSLSSKGRILDHLHAWRLVVERLGLGWSILGVLLAGFVVTPRLNRRLAKANWKENFVYFGHLRRWKPDKLKEKLRSLDADQELDVLAVQLVSTSKIAWYKHSLLQFAMACLLIGIVLVALSVAWP